jgi:uracil-DNA glycosylase family 4
MRNVETQECNKCPGAENPNWGIEGENKQKRIIVVLECSDQRALGFDYEEKLFQSKTGRVLKEILGDNLEQVVITNTVKCLFDGGSRKPNRQEFSLCAVNALKQIEEYKPEIILCLGEKAAEAITGRRYRDVLGKVIGKVVVAHHPRVMTIEERKMIREILELTI